MVKGDRRDELLAALDEVERQLASMPVSEVLRAEDLEWSWGAVFVWAQVTDEPPTVELEAMTGGLRRRATMTRTITLK